MPIGNIPGALSTNEKKEKTIIWVYDHTAYNFSYKTV